MQNWTIINRSISGEKLI